MKKTCNNCKWKYKGPEYPPCKTCKGHPEYDCWEPIE